MNKNHKMKKIGILMLTAAMLGGTMGQNVYASTMKNSNGKQIVMSHMKAADEVVQGELDDKDGNPSGVHWSFDKTNGVLSITGSGVPVMDGVAGTIPWGSYLDQIQKVSIDKTVRPQSMNGWFLECSNLKEAPEIPEGVENAAQMFSKCSSLEKAPKLPGTIKNAESMFRECTNLKESPEILEGVEDAGYMFFNCSSLEKAPKLSGTIKNAQGMFDGCTNLKEGPEIPESVENARYMFFACFSLEKASKLPGTIRDAYEMFSRCTNLKESPEISEGVEDATGMFSDCSSLEKAPKLPGTIKSAYGMFNGCTNLKEGPEIPESVEDGRQMFFNCSSLEKAPKLPGTIKNASNMFRGCINLKESPEIPEGVEDAEAMFYGCSSLKELPRISGSARQIDMTKMFWGCTKIEKISKEWTIPKGAVTDDLFGGSLQSNGLKLPTLVAYGNESLKDYKGWETDGRELILYCTVEIQNQAGETLKVADVIYGEALRENEIPKAPHGYHWNAQDLSLLKIKKIEKDQKVTLRAEKNEYTVTFKDYDGTVLDTCKVKYEEAARAPQGMKRNGYTFTGWDKDFSRVVKDLVVTAKYKKNAPTIKGTSSYTKAYGSKKFRLNVKAAGKVSFRTSNAKVVKVSSNGTVTIKGTGIATITETAVSGSSRAVKKVTIKIVPKKQKVKGKAGKKKLIVRWNKDKRASGYQIQLAKKKNFKKAKTYTVKSYKTYKKTIKRLKSRKKYYVRVRAYKRVGKTKLYGKFSTAKKIKVK